jgi:hypothetical protein
MGHGSIFKSKSTGNPFCFKPLNIPVDHIKAALDEEERARIEVDEAAPLY